ncbi:scavenger receptor cysteine-rich type 1 protein M130-like, partial [Pygocentrus nattereri]|uniref:scavenger receptor cysteine-rich type 1 protein M130-like n=1 Tax=Pygocentrus nattereri TaxID=42514 RepID=UPI001890D5A7
MDCVQSKREMDSCVVLILLSSTVTLTTAGFYGSMRFVNGDSRCSGRVELLYEAHWRTLCGDRWHMTDAAVICRELGCGDAVDLLGDSHFGPGSGPVWLYARACDGSESVIKQCGAKNLKSINTNCDHKDIGIICSEVRLVGGSRCSGRVEVLHGETWSTVCDADFEQQDAEVVCR